MGRISIPFLTSMIFLITTSNYSQISSSMDDLHGEFENMARGLHDGNRVKTTFYNDGLVGSNHNNPSDIGAEWPKNSGHVYLGQQKPFIGAEVKDINGFVQHIVSEPIGNHPENPDSPGTGDASPFGDWWTFLPLPGFHNPEQALIAMDKREETWPSYWPDQAADGGWPGDWNGYFGRDQRNADLESYFVVDDYNNREFQFYPDSTDTLRQGLGMRMKVRGLQWSNPLVQDNIFFVFDIENIGTYDHEKMLFGYNSGPVMGNSIQGGGGESSDDDGAYDLDLNLVYVWDGDDKGAPGGWPVGFLGYSFLESPGNQFDGIDNDNDGKQGPGPIVTEALFAAKRIGPDDPIVLIDYNNYYKRTITTLRDTLPSLRDTLKIQYGNTGQVIQVWDGKVVREQEYDGIDNNLNGLIDENNGAEIGSGVRVYLYAEQQLKYKDYITGAGCDNRMIDERRDDGIDNVPIGTSIIDEERGPWNGTYDDVGINGKPGDGDFGEGDGQPTSGWQPIGTVVNGRVVTENSGKVNDLGLVNVGTGEPHIDNTDIRESDQIGLTSFLLYSYSDIPIHADETVWQHTIPGYIDLQMSGTGQDTDEHFGSGYFPMPSGQIERFSVSMFFGMDFDELKRNKYWVQFTYDENYNFAKAPLIPTLEAVAGDRKVRLFWDDVAEQSLDPVSGMDFEGYRLYRATDHAFQDAGAVTDGYGSFAFHQPFQQFDLENQYEGFMQVDIKGVKFFLGNNTGLNNHSFVDTTVTNGQLYYFALTAYDHGEPYGIPPSECVKQLSVSADGTVEMGKNVVAVRPEAPAAGYQPADLTKPHLVEGLATGRIEKEVVDKRAILDENTYQVSFLDTFIHGGRRDPDHYHTTAFTLVNKTTGDTLIKNSPLVRPGDELPITQGFRLSLYNAGYLPEDLEKDESPDLVFDQDRSHWNHDNILRFDFEQYKHVRLSGFEKKFADYRIEFSATPGLDTSKTLQLTKSFGYEAMPVNFKVYNVTDEKYVDFAFYEKDITGGAGLFTMNKKEGWSDRIILWETATGSEDSVLTWEFMFDEVDYYAEQRFPTTGDVAYVFTKKPFMHWDKFEFTTKAEYVDKEAAATDLDDIKVVPNPYIVGNSWEPVNPYSTGRGPQELHFTHLPAKCTIRIFNVRGQLVDILEHDNEISNGTHIWDMQTKDDLRIVFGIYVYHIDAGELGQKIGKFAVIQ